MSSLLYSPVNDYLVGSRRYTLSPFLSSPLLFAVSYYPEIVRRAIENFSSKIPGWQVSAENLDLSGAKTALQVLFALALVRQVHKLLRLMAQNSWRVTTASGWDDWASEIAVVTGGSSGIGKDIVDRLSAMGMSVAILDIQNPPKDVLDDPKVRFYKCDVSATDSVAAAADAVRRDIGHPSILINNAGIASPVSILKMDESYLRKIFGVNTLALWFTTQQFLPRMIQLNKGHVITVASLASFVALPTAADYGASKAGALAFHEALGCELKHVYKAPHVLTTVVHPNFVRTPLTTTKGLSERLEKAGVRMLTSDVIADSIVQQIRSKRGGQLFMPEATAIVAGIRGWPSWLQEPLRDLLGSSS